VAEGGLLETVVDGETGILLDEAEPEALAEAVNALSAERAATMRGPCENRADEFSTQRFLDSMEAAIQSGRSQSADSSRL